MSPRRGLRQSATHGFFVWVFFLPGAVLGIPWQLVATSYALNVLYQFGLHTRQIGRLGLLEWVLNTPSHHRVHHGCHGKYLDRNYGGVLIVWDRLFGTFQAEEEEPRYGLTTPIRSANPLWANLHGYALIAATWRQAGDWRGRFRALLGPPEALHQVAPAPPPAVPRLTTGYVAIQLALAAAATLTVVTRPAVAGEVRLGVALAVVVTLVIGGGLLDGQRWARRGELVRLAILVGAMAMVLRS